ncbi:hypothetical protein BOW55_15115, partial [Flavobacterium sp. YO12]
MPSFARFIFVVLLFLSASINTFAQVCGTPGVDGPIAITGSVNTYFPISGDITLNAGAQSILLGKVPDTDRHNNNFGGTPISAGDLILIIQMQDATIDYRDNANYGSGITTSGSDSKGGTGFTNIGNTGVFEYVIATNNVPITGGNLTFKGTGSNNGVRNSFYNAIATTSTGKKTFQVIRVPQYSNLTLNSDITTPPFNGVAGGVIAFNVSGTFNFNGKKIDGNARGFRGGFSPQAYSGANNASIYVANTSNTIVSGKGEGIAGTPRFMWDGFNQVDNVVEGMPGGSAGRGAPANAGGGGNDHNTGGGGGGNGGFGGLGGYGWQGFPGGDRWPNFTGGGRPGFKSYTQTIPPLTRLIMGGGGGAGDANNAVDGVKGGVGGAIVLINAGTVQGTGTIEANGGDGAPGVYSGSPDGAGGAGAGGTVLLNISNSSTGAITINAKGGNGGNTERDTNNEHGPGGGGGGGVIRHNIVGSVAITTNVNGGGAGVTRGAANNVGSTSHGAEPGTDGHVSTFTSQDLPPNLQVNASCFPILETTVRALTTSEVCGSIGEKVTYEIQIKNTGAGNAAGVLLDFSFPASIEFDAATASYSTEASGPSGALSSTGSANNPLIGNFNIAQNGVVTITLVGRISGTLAAGKHSSSAQAQYLDPTRRLDATRKITAALNGYGTVNKKYEGANQADVPGTNFNGTGSTIIVDDITILALPAAPTVNTTQGNCTTPTGTITVTAPANGPNVSYTLTGTNPVTASTNNATGVFPGLVSGTYQITTTNAQGCTSLPTTGISITAVSGAPTATGVSICVGGSGLLTATSTCSSNFVNSGTTISGTWSATTDPTALRPTTSMSNSSSCGFDNNSSRNYVAIPFQVSTSGYYIFEMDTSASSDPMGYIVSGAFVPGSCSTGNWIKGDDDSAGSRLPRLGTTGSGPGAMNLQIGITYTLISTTYSNANGTGTFSGNFSWKITQSPNGGQIMLQTPGTINWYTVASGGTSIGSGNSFNPVGVAGSGIQDTNTAKSVTFYAACSSNPSCRTAVNFVINEKPTITGIVPASRCDSGSVTLEATASSGTINWYTAATGGSIVATGTSYKTPSLSTTTDYYVEAVANGCTSAVRTKVTATVNTTPTITSTTPRSGCAGETVILSASASAGTINWYSNVTGGISLGTGTNFTTPNLSATTTYYVDATSNNCTTGSRVAVAATVYPLPTAYAVTGGGTYCTGGIGFAVGLSNSDSGVSYQLQLGGVNNGTPVIGTGTAISFGTKTAAGTYTVVATNTNSGTSCTATMTGNAVITISTFPAALALTGSTICVSPGGNGTITSSTSVSGVNYQLYNSSNTPVQGSIPGTGSGLTWSNLIAGNGYYVAATNASNCSTNSNTVNVATTPNPAAPAVGITTQPTCTVATGSVVLNGLPSGTWTIN